MLSADFSVIFQLSTALRPNLRQIVFVLLMSCTFHRQKFRFCGKVIWIYRQNRLSALFYGILQYLTGVVLPTDDHLLSWINTMAAAARRTRRVISAVNKQTNFTILKGDHLQVAAALNIPRGTAWSIIRRHQRDGEEVEEDLVSWMRRCAKLLCA